MSPYHFAWRRQTSHGLGRQSTPGRSPVDPPSATIPSTTGACPLSVPLGRVGVGPGSRTGAASGPVTTGPDAIGYWGGPSGRRAGDWASAAPAPARTAATV